MIFRFRKRKFFLFLLPFLFSLLFLGVVANFSTSNNKQDSKFYTTTFRKEATNCQNKQNLKRKSGTAVWRWLTNKHRDCDFSTAWIIRIIPLINLWRIKIDSKVYSLEAFTEAFTKKYDALVKQKKHLSFSKLDRNMINQLNALSRIDNWNLKISLAINKEIWRKSFALPGVGKKITDLLTAGVDQTGLNSNFLLNLLTKNTYPVFNNSEDRLKHELNMRKFHNYFFSSKTKLTQHAISSNLFGYRDAIIKELTKRLIVNEKNAEEVWKHFQKQENKKHYATLKNNGYKVIGDVNIEKLPALRDLSISFSEFKGADNWASILETLKKLWIAGIYKKFYPRSWIKVFQSKAGTNLINRLKLLKVDTLLIKGKRYTMTNIKKIDWKNINSIENLKKDFIELTNEEDGTKTYELAPSNASRAKEELIKLVENPEITLHDLFQAVNQILISRRTIPLIKSRILPSPSQDGPDIKLSSVKVDPAKLKEFFSFFKLPFAKDLVLDKLSDWNISQVKINDKDYSVKAIKDFDFSGTASYDDIQNPAVKSELTAFVKDDLNFFNLISAVDSAQYEILFKALKDETANNLLSKLKKIRWLQWLVTVDDFTTQYSIDSIKLFDFSQVEKFSDISHEGTKQEIINLVQGNLKPADIHKIIQPFYFQEVLIDQLKLPINQTKILDKMRSLKLTSLNINDKDYAVDVFQTIDFTKISDYFLDINNRQARDKEWNQIFAFAKDGINIQQMIDGLKKEEIKQKTEVAWTWLKNNNRLVDIKEYDLASIKDGTDGIVSLDELLELDPQTDGYDTFTPEQVDLLSALSKINDAKAQIDVLIQAAKVKKEKIDSVLVWLKEPNRLADIKKYKITSETVQDANEDDVELNQLLNITTLSNHDDLSELEKALLLKFDDSIKDEIDNLISNAKTIERRLKWLKKDNRLADIAKYKIASETVKDDFGFDVVLSELAKIKGDSTYKNLLGPAKALLLEIDQTAKNQIDALIQAGKEKEKITEALEWLKAGTRLDDIETHKISEIDDGKGGKTPLKNLKDLQTTDNYDDLEVEEKVLLLSLSEIADAQSQIDALIKAGKDKAKITETLEWFKEPNRLGDIEKYNIKEINEDKNVKTPLSDLSELETGDTYADLEAEEKALLLKLSKISDAKKQIDALIKAGKDKAKITETLTWLQTETRLADIVKYKIEDEMVQVDDKTNVDLSELAKITNASTYGSLSKEGRVLLLKIDQTAKNQIDALIKAGKEKEKINESLRWLQTGTRLADIKTYNLLYPVLLDITDASTYESLSKEAKAFLLIMNKKTKNQIDDIIEESKAIETVLEWLKEANRLSDIETYKISEIDDGAGGKTPLKNLKDLKTTDNYGDLEVEEKALLSSLSEIVDAQTQIDALIKAAKEKAKITETLEWLKKDNRLADIAKYNIASESVLDNNESIIELDELSNINNSSTYESLSPDTKFLLLKSDNFLKGWVTYIIGWAKDIEGKLRWLKKDNRLADIAKYKIADETVQNVDEDLDLSELAKIKADSTYKSLLGPAKTLLSKIDESAKSQIDALIKAAQSKEKIKEVLKWLNESERLNDIKTYKIQDEKIKNDKKQDLSLTHLGKITPVSTYETLNQDQKNLLLNIANISENKGKNQINDLIKSFKDGINDLIKNFQKPNSILTKLKDLDKNKINVKEKNLSFKNLLKVKDWKKPNILQALDPKTQKELVNIIKSLSNNRKRIPEINSAIEKIENKETGNVTNQVVMWIYIGLGIIALLMISLFAFRYLKNKNNK